MQCAGTCEHLETVSPMYATHGRPLPGPATTLLVPSRAPMRAAAPPPLACRCFLRLTCIAAATICATCVTSICISICICTCDIFAADTVCAAIIRRRVSHNLPPMTFTSPARTLAATQECRTPRTLRFPRPGCGRRGA